MTNLTDYARRVLELTMTRRENCGASGTGTLYTSTFFSTQAEALEQYATAILQELVDSVRAEERHPKCPKCKESVWIKSKGECECGMRYENGRFSDDHIIHAAVASCVCINIDDAVAHRMRRMYDNPLESFVTTSEEHPTP